MSAELQRRLDTLIGRAKKAELTNEEKAELEDLLEDVDRKSFWLVARLIARQNHSAPNPRPAQRSRASAR